MKFPFPRYDAETVEAIEEHLDQQNLTEIVGATPMAGEGLVTVWVRGNGTKSYSRPMIQVLGNEQFSGRPAAIQTPVTPCQCYRFDRSWDCPDHPPIPWNTKERRWERPCTGADGCGCPSCAMPRSYYSPPASLLQMVEEVSAMTYRAVSRREVAVQALLEDGRSGTFTFLT